MNGDSLKEIMTVDDRIEWYLEKGRISGCKYLPIELSYEEANEWFNEYLPIWKSMFSNLPSDEERKHFSRKLKYNLIALSTVQKKGSVKELILNDFVPEIERLKLLKSSTSFALMVYVCQEVGEMEMFEYPKGGKKDWLIEYGKQRGYSGDTFHNSYSSIVSQEGKPFQSENGRWNYTKSNAVEVMSFLDSKSKAFKYLESISKPFFE